MRHERSPELRERGLTAYLATFGVPVALNLVLFSFLGHHTVELLSHVAFACFSEGPSDELLTILGSIWVTLSLLSAYFCYPFFKA